MSSPISVTIFNNNYPSSTIQATFKNQSPSQCFEIPHHVLMDKGRLHNNFEITNQLTHETAVYTRPEVKLRPSYSPLQPGETKVVEVQLDQSYQLPTGQNSVKYIAQVDYRNCDDASKLHTDIIQSNMIDIKV